MLFILQKKILEPKRGVTRGLTAALLRSLITSPPQTSASGQPVLALSLGPTRPQPGLTRDPGAGLDSVAAAAALPAPVAAPPGRH